MRVVLVVPAVLGMLSLGWLVVEFILSGVAAFRLRRSLRRPPLLLLALLLAPGVAFAQSASPAASAWAWLAANWPIVGPVVLVLLTSLANGLRDHPGEAGIVHTMIDVLSFVTNRNSPGTFKLPGTTSPPAPVVGSALK